MRHTYHSSGSLTATVDALETERTLDTSRSLDLSATAVPFCHSTHSSPPANPVTSSSMRCVSNVFSKAVTHCSGIEQAFPVNSFWRPSNEQITCTCEILMMLHLKTITVPKRRVNSYTPGNDRSATSRTLCNHTPTLTLARAGHFS